MESQNHDGDDSMVPRKPSLLDEVLKTLRVEGPNTPIISRVVVAGALTPTESIRAFFEHLMGEEMGYKRAGSQEPIDARDTIFTGMLVETPKNFVHFLEGPPRDLLKYIRDMKVKADEEDTCQDSVVIAYTDDIGERSFSKWTTIEQANHGEPPPPTEDGLAKCIVDLIYGLKELGKLIFQKEKLQMMQFLAGVKSTHPETLPSINQIDAFIGHPGKDLCLSVDEFLDTFDKPVDLKLHGELIWPVPPPLHY
eukprot:Sspe_Gene.75762::Locus_47333_Transcript_1_1_Confidence_1.000_Length_863::g.75762::m.75762